jgi:hypothetical protein
MKLSLKKHQIISITFIIAVALIGFAFYYQRTEAFENMSKTTIVSSLDKRAGFYSMLFFTINHYIFCRNNRINFRINSDDWLFKSNKGWTDYFEDVQLRYYKSEDGIEENLVTNTLGNYTIYQYKEAIREFYRYNDKTVAEIAKAKNKFNLVNGEYDSIFIRRGDKLGEESRVLAEDIYLRLLVEKSPDCKVIFVQTDDYNSYVKIKELVEYNALGIRVYTLCDPESSGVVVYGSQKDKLNNAAQNNGDNKDYLSTVIDKLNSSKSVEEMNGEEIYKHSIDMIIGIDILSNSNVCVTDYQSNVSRFIKLTHKSPENVYNIMDPTNDIDYFKTAFPGHGFE